MAFVEGQTPLLFNEGVSAGDLKVGVKVLLSDGSYGIIENVRAIHYDIPQITYNFEVSDFHTYYVGNGVLVHNMNGLPCGKKIYRGYNDGQSQKTFASNRQVDKLDGLVQSSSGPSTNTNPFHKTMNVFDHVDEITSIPDELMFKYKPSLDNPGHYEIVPQQPMSMSKFNKLLANITYRFYR